MSDSAAELRAKLEVDAGPVAYKSLLREALYALEAREREVAELQSQRKADEQEINDLEKEAVNTDFALKGAIKIMDERTAALTRLREKARALAKKLHEVVRSDEYISVFTVSQLHVGPYTGPQFGKELEELEAELPPEEAGRE